MISHLTVDLDYWEPQHSKDWQASLDTLLMEVCRQVPVRACFRQHDEVLSMLKQPLDMLINVDRHDDLVPEDKIREADLEGSWVTHVPWRKAATYRWHYPSKAPQCGGLYPSVMCWDTAVWFEGRASGWRKLEAVERCLDTIPWDTVVSTSVVHSPDFTHKRVWDHFQRRWHTLFSVGGFKEHVGI